MLKVKNLTKKYKDFVAVNNISFTINQGEIVGLLGPNGAGKSTTIKSIIGLLRIDSGHILINEKDHTSIDAKREFAYIPEFPNLYDQLSIWEHIEFIAKAYGKKDYKAIALEYLERFDLIDKKDELTTELSKGMKQKLSIICNLVIDPKIYFFDEPMIGLDPKAIKTLKNLLVELKNQGKAIFISTHLLDSIEHICDQILVMKNGAIITRGSLEELKGTQEISLEELFLQVTQDE
ncbi:MAG TPA: ABC transporter ATP-binding protein [Clostridia bacterium]|nr:ABC transporter ATP-binding protein [Clostridia bacterium]